MGRTPAGGRAAARSGRGSEGPRGRAVLEVEVQSAVVGGQAALDGGVQHPPRRRGGGGGGGLREKEG